MESNLKETSDSLKLRDVQNTQLVLFENVKVMKGKEGLKSCFQITGD